MRLVLHIVLFWSFSLACCAQESPFLTKFERSKGKETATYHEVIQFYKKLALSFETVQLLEMGKTDSGEPLHIVLFNDNKAFQLDKENNKQATILINNGIHPGESDGIDATMMLFRDMAEGKISASENLKIATIPVYNIGGSLNRNSTSRTNQNGPLEYGFRGNARNYDLNRDFIKSDTKNAQAFAEIFHFVNPDVFIDNHVSNGADYQYTLTHLFTQHNKLGGVFGQYLKNQFQPKFEKQLEQQGWRITPYVNVFNEVPEKGFTQFMDYPRYSTGYTTLFNTLGVMVETHMLKPYTHRVEGTYVFMRELMNSVEQDLQTIKAFRRMNANQYQIGHAYPITWSVDQSKPSKRQFHGYEAERIESEVTGLTRLRYNQNKPFEKEINYFDVYHPIDYVTIPKGYILPKAWGKIIERLKWNQIEMIPLKEDKQFQVEVYHIKSYKTAENPFEGHYPHQETKVKSTQEVFLAKKGDYYIPCNQKGIRYILETLEPQAKDSFFNWNFFDTILQQKEHFSPYVWEDKAKEILKNNPVLKEEFLQKKKMDKKFAKDWYAQLDFIHKRSPNYEQAHLRYPVYRVLK